LETVVWRCRVLYNTALQRRKTWWGRGPGTGATYSQQRAELPDIMGFSPAQAMPL